MTRWGGRAIKILCVGLLIHFFLHTWVTFGRGWSIDLIRAWKEGVIGLLSIGAAWLLITRSSVRSRLRETKRFWPIVAVFCVGVFGTLLIHYLVVDAPVTRWLMAMRYDYLGFFLLLVGWIYATARSKKTTKELIQRHGRLMKRVLLGALVWWCIVAIKPGTMKLFGFNNYVFEGTVGMQPPAVYYTHINYGLPRSQFLFERPTTFGFWLTAFFPLFFVQFLLRRPWYHTWGRWSIYGLNILLTFSRAAWGSWIIIVLLCIGLTSNLPWKKLLVKYGLPMFLVFGTVLAVGREQIMLRGYSNYGHMTMVKLGRDMFLEKPLRGWGGAHAGPGSHRDGGLAFNPENQFLQILIEFGKIGSLPWLLLRGRTVCIGLFGAGRKKEWLLAVSLGMVTLTLSGMVLHSFADRMVVYPFMLVAGLIVGMSFLPSSKTFQQQTTDG